MRVAIVHDWLTGMRGGEKCLEVFCEIFPEADIFTLLPRPKPWRAAELSVTGGGGDKAVCARELKKRYADSSVCILEKERECGLHASGRNSGVLHAGFYYTADSFKARFTRDGNQKLTKYCDSKNG